MEMVVILMLHRLIMIIRIDAGYDAIYIKTTSNDEDDDKSKT